MVRTKIGDQANLEIGGGFGWRVEFSRFGASKKTTVKSEQAGWGVKGGGRKRWCGMENPIVQCWREEKPGGECDR
jgi:hypothetical protein